MRIKVFQNNQKADDQLVHRSPIMVGAMTDLSAFDLAYSIYCFLLGDSACNSKDEVLYEIVNSTGYGKKKEVNAEGKKEEVHFETYSKVPEAVIDHLTKLIKDAAPKQLGVTTTVGVGTSIVRDYREKGSDEVKFVTVEHVAICITKARKK